MNGLRLRWCVLMEKRLCCVWNVCVREGVWGIEEECGEEFYNMKMVMLRFVYTGIFIQRSVVFPNHSGLAIVACGSDIGDEICGGCSIALISCCES